MHSDTPDNARSLDATPASARGESAGALRDASQTLRPKSEADFLAEEIACTQGSLLAAVDRLRRDVAEVVNPQEWVDKHPWLSLTAAASAGFLAATAVVPSADESAAEKWSRLKSHLPEMKADENSASSTTIRSIITTFLTTNLIQIGRMVAEKYLSGGAWPESAEEWMDSEMPAEEVGGGSGI